MGRAARNRRDRRAASDAIDLDDRGAVVARVRGEHRRGIHLGGGADDKEHVAVARRVLGARERIVGQRLLEPHDVGAQEGAALRAPRRLARARIVPRRDDRPVARALDALDIAVELDHVRAARRLMQPVDVLRDHEEVGLRPFDRRQRAVSRIGRRTGDQLAAPGIPIPDELRVAAERVGRGELERIELRPHAGLRVAKRRHAGFGRDSRAGQRGNRARLAQAVDQRSRNGGGFGDGRHRTRRSISGSDNSRCRLILDAIGSHVRFFSRARDRRETTSPRVLQ